MEKGATITNQKYRWVILGVSSAVMFVIMGMQWMSMPVLFFEISQETGIDLSKLQILWAIIPFAGLFSCFPAGILADKYGAYPLIGISSLLCSIFGGLRGISPDFTIMLIFTFLYGITSYIPVVVLPKLIGQWFGKNELGTAQGVTFAFYTAGAAVAMAISATVISPAIGGWKNTYLLYGGLSLVVTVFWYLLAGKKPAISKEDDASIQTYSDFGGDFRGIIKTVIKDKDVWLLIAIYSIYMGGYIGFFGLFPGLLKEWGWSASAADLSLAVATIASIFGCILIPMLSDKIGSRRWVYTISLAIAGALAFISFIVGRVPDSPLLWVMIIFLGLFGGAMPIVFTIPMELKKIGPALSGSVVGLMNTGSNIAGTIYTLLGAYLLGFGPLLPGVLFGIFGFLLSGLVMIFVTETGTKMYAKN